MVLMDLNLPRIGGIETTDASCTVLPNGPQTGMRHRLNHRPDRQCRRADRCDVRSRRYRGFPDQTGDCVRVSMPHF